MLLFIGKFYSKKPTVYTNFSLIFFTSTFYTAIYLHNEKSFGSNIFCSEVLCKDRISKILNASFLCWGWDITTCFNRNKFVSIN